MKCKGCVEYWSSKGENKNKKGWGVEREKKANLFHPSLSFLKEDQAGIANTTLVSLRREPLANDRVGACLDHSILEALGAGNRSIELGPVHVEHTMLKHKAKAVGGDDEPEYHEQTQRPG